MLYGRQHRENPVQVYRIAVEYRLLGAAAQAFSTTLKLLFRQFCIADGRQNTTGSGFRRQESTLISIASVSMFIRSCFHHPQRTQKTIRDSFNKNIIRSCSCSQVFKIGRQPQRLRKTEHIQQYHPQPFGAQVLMLRSIFSTSGRLKTAYDILLIVGAYSPGKIWYIFP